jgi:U3 small nucleolar RNA-associated protein 14
VKDSSGSLKKELRHWDKKRLLEPPLEKPIAEKIKRKVAFDETVGEVSKWDSVVDANRNASQLHFPLKQNNLRLEPARQFVKHFTPKTQLEIQVSQLLTNSDNNVTEDKVLIDLVFI